MRYIVTRETDSTRECAITQFPLFKEAKAYLKAVPVIFHRNTPIVGGAPFRRRGSRFEFWRVHAVDESAPEFSQTMAKWFPK